MIFLKYFILFTISFLILSIPISRKPLFFHLHKNLNPFTETLFDMVEKESKEKIKKGKEMGAKLLNNSLQSKNSR